MKRYTAGPLAIIAGIIVVLLVVAGIGVALYSEHANQQTRTCTVTGRDRTTIARDTASTSDMRIYTEECGTLKVADLMTHGQYNSADIYASIHQGARYEITTVGWRIPFLSAFPTILGTPTEVTR